jgi:hypothetical protein
MARPRHKLFHSIVIMGMGLSSHCDDQEQQLIGMSDAGDAGDGDSGAGDGDGGTGDGDSGAGDGDGGTGDGDSGAGPKVIANPADCEFRTQFRCESYAPETNCVCDETRPRSADDCGGPARLFCSAYVCEPGDLCVTSATVFNSDCVCDETAPLSSSDCDAPQQFHCRVPFPATACRCDPDAPLAPEDCEHSEQFACAAYFPEYVTCGCETDRPIGPEDCADDDASCSCAIPPGFNCESGIPPADAGLPQFACRCGCLGCIR